MNWIYKEKNGNGREETTPTKNVVKKTNRKYVFYFLLNDKSRIKIMLRWNYESSHRRRCRLNLSHRIPATWCTHTVRPFARSFIKVNYIEWDISGIQLRIHDNLSWRSALCLCVRRTYVNQAVDENSEQPLCGVCWEICAAAAGSLVSPERKAKFTKKKKQTGTNLFGTRACERTSSTANTHFFLFRRFNASCEWVEFC